MHQIETSILRLRGPWGVPIDVQPSILFLLFLIIGVHASGGAEAMMDGVIIAAILIGSILLHELGHAWGALVQGVRVSRITLHGAGGTCLHAAAPMRLSEFITVMGPLVNLALWAILSLLAEAIWATQATPGAGDQFQLAAWLWFAAELNLMLFILNMMPVQPLDGGKLAFFALSRALPDGRALQVAGALGLVFSLIWVPVMLVLFVTFGFVFLFLPSLRLHWSMLREGRSRTRTQP
ncbi:site-2 protease family protein [uncultured Tateyamaria sp.]|uniref:site-2 protease family protein n=1 Tax=uncultured Tateyamaria sp. TaxID=455651 RepID=UPI00261A1DFD|nr:site-2 protease family protein [uncultured Tateyamaria sp.]